MCSELRVLKGRYLCSCPKTWIGCSCHSRFGLMADTKIPAELSIRRLTLTGCETDSRGFPGRDAWATRLASNSLNFMLLNYHLWYMNATHFCPVLVFLSRNAYNLTNICLIAHPKIEKTTKKGDIIGIRNTHLITVRHSSILPNSSAEISIPVNTISPY